MRSVVFESLTMDFLRTIPGGALLERAFSVLKVALMTPYSAAFMVILLTTLVWAGWLTTKAFSRQTQRTVVESDVRITKLLVHPIKSCRGTSMQEVRYTAEGIENDRKWVIVQRDTHKFITAREHPQMVLITPIVRPDLSFPTGGTLSVSFPAESNLPEFSVPLSPTAAQLATWEYIQDIGFWNDAQLDGYVVQSTDCSSRPQPNSPSETLSAFMGIPVLLIMKGPARRPTAPTPLYPKLDEYGSAQFQDGFPLFVTTTESLNDLQEKVKIAAASTKDGEGKWRVGGMDVSRWGDGSGLVMERFRPNIVLSGVSAPWVEDTWAEIAFEDTVSDPYVDHRGRAQLGTETIPGSKLLGTSSPARKLQLVSRGTRCLLPNVDPVTGVRDAAIPYKVMTKFRNVDPVQKFTPCFGVNAVPVLAIDDAVQSGDQPTGTRSYYCLRVGEGVHVTRLFSEHELALVNKKDC